MRHGWRVSRTPAVFNPMNKHEGRLQGAAPPPRNALKLSPAKPISDSLDITYVNYSPDEVFHSPAYQQNAINALLNLFLRIKNRPSFSYLVNRYCFKVLTKNIALNTDKHGEFYLVTDATFRIPAQFSKIFSINYIKVEKELSYRLRSIYVGYNNQQDQYRILDHSSNVNKTGEIKVYNSFKECMAATFDHPIEVPLFSVEDFSAFIMDNLEKARAAKTSLKTAVANTSTL